MLREPISLWFVRYPVYCPCVGRTGCASNFYDCCAWGASYRKRSELRTNVPQLKRLQRACFDMPEHTHEHLDGKVTFLTDRGSRKSIWKTKLAGKYVPEWCHAYARIIFEIAPERARVHGGRQSWSLAWQRQLVVATGFVAQRQLGRSYMSLARHIRMGRRCVNVEPQRPRRDNSGDSTRIWLALAAS